MKLSDQTISILKNYSTINESLLFTEGNRLRTIAKNKSLLASAKIEETIPVKFAIYNLNQFLSAMTMFGQADLDFTEKSVKMTFSDGRSINYTCADESLVITPPDILLVMSLSYLPTNPLIRSRRHQQLLVSQR